MINNEAEDAILKGALKGISENIDKQAFGKIRDSILPILQSKGISENSCETIFEMLDSAYLLGIDTASERAIMVISKFFREKAENNDSAQD